jgi:pyrimidine-nucleoside phosphorylase
MTSIDPRQIVAAKRDGRTLAPGDIQALIEGYTHGEIGDPLAAAFLMAALIRGLDEAETLALTEATIASGETISFTGLDRPTVDKHSTGGVADSVTLVFAPVAAALGLAVAKLSGRGLGHTGGTLDKLEAIPGLRTDLTPEEIRSQVDRIGCAVAAQSALVVPADGALYALRDATATVPSIPLIAASVMSKKLAVLTDLILLDVKAGSGAFMKTPEEAERLARVCLGLARGMDRPARAAVSDMSQPLGDAIGNALDIVEAVEVLRGSRRGRLRELVVLFAGQAAAATAGGDLDEAVGRAERALDDGSALERFRLMVEAQGGDPRVVDDPGAILPRAPVIIPLLAHRTGVLAATKAEEVGLASGALGAGRMHKGDRIDPAVGIVLHAKIGDRLEEGMPIGEVYAREEVAAREAARRTLAALELTQGAVEAPPLVYMWLDESEEGGRTGSAARA